jgi:hypothetical protein
VPRSKHKRQCNVGTGPSVEDLAALAEAFNALYKGLIEAKQMFDGGRNGGREGAIHAVETVLKFLEKSGPIRSHGLHVPLAALFNALMNLDDGVVLPILKKARRTGRGRASATRESIKGAVAFTVHGLHATGLQMPAAHKLVASALQKQEVKAERGRDQGVTARTVRGWCEDVAADVSRHGEAAQTYDGLIADPDLRVITKGLPPKEARKGLLGLLAELLKKTRSQKSA